MGFFGFIISSRFEVGFFAFFSSKFKCFKGSLSLVERAGLVCNLCVPIVGYEKRREDNVCGDIEI